MSADGSSSLIVLRGITKVFLTDEIETHALSNISLEINKGEYVSIAGPSGCGKSTLLSILGLLDTPTGGSYLLNGRPVADLAFAERARVRNREIGFIFQSFNLIGDLDVFHNVELPLTYRDMPAAKRAERAVAGEPAILLADEPTGNLDSRSGEAVMELLEGLHRQGSTICMVTQDSRYAGHAHRAVHLFDGALVERERAAG